MKTFTNDDLRDVQRELNCSHRVEFGKPCDISSGGWWTCGCAVIAWKRAQAAKPVNGQ